MEYLFSLVIGYFFGCFNLAYFLAKKRGFDIRDKGSNNPGASNATITMGWKVGVMVGACDILKAVIPSLIAAWLFPNCLYGGLAAGVGSVLGHMFPFYLKFRGGKGFASFLGMVIVHDWRFFLVLGVAILLITWITDYIALATFTTVIAFPVYLYLFHGSLLPLGIVSIVSVIIIIKHIENIKKMLSGQEIGLRSAFRSKKEA